MLSDKSWSFVGKTYIHIPLKGPNLKVRSPEPPLEALLLVGAAPEGDVHPGEDLEDLAGDERHRQHDQDVRDVLLLL